MLSKLILDKLIPLPTEELLLEQIKAELLEEGFPLTYLKSGGIFYMLLRVFIRIEVELLGLCRLMLGNLTISAADRVEWLELRAADFSKYRKQPLKTEGKLTLTRAVTTAAVRIPKGCIFKTTSSTTGEQLGYFSIDEVVFPQGEATCFVPVIAEAAGSGYNVPAGKITECLLHLETVTGITNADGWITREGSDIEQLESLRSRTLGAFAELATHPTRDKYRSVCEAVPGVLYVSVDDQHPRGQGTVDIIVTSATGEASDALLEEVAAAANSIAGAYDNLLVKSSETITQDVTITIVLPATLNVDGVAQRVEEVMRELFRLSRSRALNELYLSDLIVAVKTALPIAKSVRITNPTDDLIQSTGEVILLGEVTVTIERV